jgi:hypothetical protein
MNLAGRIHLKNRMNSASCAPETRADVMRRRSGLLAASFGPERARDRFRLGLAPPPSSCVVLPVAGVFGPLAVSFLQAACFDSRAWSV